MHNKENVSMRQLYKNNTHLSVITHGRWTNHNEHNIKIKLDILTFTITNTYKKNNECKKLIYVVWISELKNETF